jgi:hypothetical protein
VQTGQGADSGPHVQTGQRADRIVEACVPKAEESVTDLERAFDEVERAAASTLESAAGLVKQARTLQKAAREGHIARMKRARTDLDASLSGLRQAVADAVESWTLPDEQEERYLADRYSGEFSAVAAKKGLEIHERDGRLISHPSIVRLLPRDRAVRMDGRKISTIRPSYLADLLLKNQKKDSRHKSDAFLESLYAVYSDIVHGESSGRLMPDDWQRVVPLARIYKLLTSLPGAGRDYDRTDFARDLYRLQDGGPIRTRKGATVSFPASSGTRQAKRDLFTFVGPDGQDVVYYGIRFTKGG